MGTKSSNSTPLAVAKTLAGKGVPYNNTTVQATFNGVVGAEDFIVQVCNALPKPDYQLSFEIAAAGPVITFQIETPLHIGPGQVQSVVASTAGKLLEDKTDGSLPSLPDFQITNNQVLVPEVPA